MVSWGWLRGAAATTTMRGLVAARGAGEAAMQGAGVGEVRRWCRGPAARSGDGGGEGSNCGLRGAAAAWGSACLAGPESGRALRASPARKRPRGPVLGPPVRPVGWHDTARRTPRDGLGPAQKSVGLVGPGPNRARWSEWTSIRTQIRLP